MSTICFYAQFVASKVGVNSLTVTWDVEQITRSDGTRSALVTGGATTITVGRRGLYGYRLASADLSLYDYVATAITATTTVDQQEIAAIGMVIPDALVSGVETETADIQSRIPAALIGGRMDSSVGAMAANTLTASALATDAGVEIAGAVRAELTTELAHLDADVSDAGLTAQQTRDAMKLAPTTGTPAAGSVDAHLDTIVSDVAAVKAITDTLDRSALTVVTVNDVGAITIKRTLTLAAVVSGLTIPADWTACFWTVKRSVDDTDADALVQILVSNPGDPDDGVQVLMGTALEDESDGSLVVNQALGTVTIALGDASTALLDDAVELVWDVKVHSPSGKTQPGTGTAIITTAVTRA